MDFLLTEEQEMMLQNVDRVAKEYDRRYWLNQAGEGTFPRELWMELGKLGYIGCDEKLWNWFQEYNWPGNVSELKNVLEASIQLADIYELQFSHIRPFIEGVVLVCIIY